MKAIGFLLLKIIAVFCLIISAMLLIGSYWDFSRGANPEHAVARLLAAIIAFISGFFISKLAVRIKGVEKLVHDQNNIYSKKYPKKWAEIFLLIDKAGGVKKPDFKNLSRKERSRVGMNWAAFFLGPFYYLALGMWRPMVSYLILMVMFYVAIDFAAIVFFGAEDINFYGAVGASGVVWGMLANTNYYRLKVLGEKNWF